MTTKMVVVLIIVVVMLIMVMMVIMMQVMKIMLNDGDDGGSDGGDDGNTGFEVGTYTLSWNTRTLRQHALIHTRNTSESPIHRLGIFKKLEETREPRENPCQHCDKLHRQ